MPVALRYFLQKEEQEALPALGEEDMGQLLMYALET
jgi:hypothetical protein